MVIIIWIMLCHWVLNNIKKTFHMFSYVSNCHTNCTCDCECLFAGVLQALQSWKTQICPEGEHPASPELWRDSFSAFRWVCVRTCALTLLCSSRAPFTNVFERARSKLVCLIQSCVCSGGGFASLIPIHFFFHSCRVLWLQQASISLVFSSLHDIFDCCHPITRLSHCAVVWM